MGVSRGTIFRSIIDSVVSTMKKVRSDNEYKEYKEKFRKEWNRQYKETGKVNWKLLLDLQDGLREKASKDFDKKLINNVSSDTRTHQKKINSDIKGNTKEV